MVNRLKPLDLENAADDQLHAALELLLDRGLTNRYLGNFFGMLALNPGVARAVGKLGVQVRFHGALPELAREAAILAACYVWNFRYDAVQHEALVRRLGMSDFQIEALRNLRFQDLPPQLAAAAEFAFAAARPGGMTQAVFDRARAHWDDRAMLDLAATAAYYAMLGSLANALDPELEDPDNPVFKGART